MMTLALQGVVAWTRPNLNLALFTLDRSSALASTHQAGRHRKHSICDLLLVLPSDEPPLLQGMLMFYDDGQ
jgi:hypothetical protein